jgi:hypothetical protein
MTRMINRLLFIAGFAVLGFSGTSNQPHPVSGAEVTVKLVLGKDATLTGHTASDDPSIFHENVVTFTANSGSPLPTPEKTGTTFVSWVYAQNSELVRVSVMPLTSGAIYFAYWNGDGSLATEGSSSEPIPTDQVTLYLDTGGASLWNQAGARFFVYTFNQETAGAWPGTEMTLVSGNIFTITVDGGFSSLIFVRRNSTNTETWNQTADLSYSPSFNLYTITGWDSGQWGTYSI